MTLQELINRDFNGNVSAFAKAYDTTRATAYRLLKGIGRPQEKLRNRLLRKGVHFGNFSKTFTIHSLKYYILDNENEKVLERLYKGAPCQWVQISFAEDREMPDDYLFPEKDAAELIKEYGGEMFKYCPQEPDYAGPNFDK